MKHIECVMNLIEEEDGKILNVESEIVSILGEKGRLTRRTIESLRDEPSRKRRSPVLEALSSVYNKLNPDPEKANMPGPPPVQIGRYFDKSVAQAVASRGVDAESKASEQRLLNRIKVIFMEKVMSSTKKSMRVQTGMQVIDKAVGGFRNGEFAVMSGNYDPIELLKTEIIYQMTTEMKIPVLYWCGLPPEREEWYGEIDAVASSVENMTIELLLRDSGVDPYGYFEGDLSDEDRGKLAESATKLKNIPLYVSSYRIPSPSRVNIDRSPQGIDKLPPVSGEDMPEKLANQVRAWSEYVKDQPCLVMVNSLLSHGSDVVAISRGLAEKARELALPIISFTYSESGLGRTDDAMATHGLRFSKKDYDFYSDLLVLVGGDEESITIDSVIRTSSD